MAKNLYVGNLTPTVKESDLETLFGESGTIRSLKIMKDHYTGHCRGFGFVEMSSNDEAQAAIKRLDGFLLDGQHIKVNEARPRAEGDYGRGRREGGTGSGGSRW
jgi:RNA recognition motif-containing protein